MSEIYIAGKFNSSEGTIADFADELEKRDHNITLRWWDLPPLQKPYLNYPKQSAQSASDMVEAIQRSDVMILFPQDDILGAAVELGVALGHEKETGREIIVVQPEIVRQSVFYAHPDITTVNSLRAIRQREWY